MTAGGTVGPRWHGRPVDAARPAVGPSYSLKITTRRRDGLRTLSDLHKLGDAPKNLAETLAPRARPPYLPGTTSSTYTDVVLHMVWRSSSTAVEDAGGRRGVQTVRCPFCRHDDSRVVDSRET